MFYSRFATYLMALLFSSAVPAIADTVTGTATFRERIMPPAQARFVAVLSDVSLADAPAVELGRFETENAGGPPYSFSIDYDAAAIDPRHTYAVRATLWVGEQMMFTTDTFTPVLTRGASAEAEIVMVRASAGKSDAPKEKAQIGAHGLQLPASFTGTLPCASCEGIRYQLNLWPDQGYTLRREWLGTDATANDAIEDDIGYWYADPMRDAIVLGGLTDTATQWQVKAPNRLRQLDINGDIIESSLPYELISEGTLTETDVKDVFLGGMMTYYADAAVFEECRTGRQYPIAMEADYAAMERAYLRDQPAAGEPLYVNVEGSLLMRPAMEGPEQRSLVVDRFVRTRAGITCERQRADAELTNTYWRIDSLAGQEVSTLPTGRREPHVILRSGDEPRYSATVGCNGMMGDYTQNGESLSFGSGASTMMACPPPLDVLERNLGQALAATQKYRINGETMVLYNEANDIIAVMTAVYLR